ncbi:MAG: response regulator [Planctomycetes bacterium]|nr:response regulator [Planctomycetota bacterium]
MEKDELIRRLMATFLGELEDHVRALNCDLLALEKKPAPEVLATLFRTAHSLKGAARSVGAGVIETACHRLEEILSGLREGREAASPDLFQLLFSTADAIQEAGGRLKRKADLAGSPLAELLPRLAAAAGGKTEGVPLPPEAPPMRPVEALEGGFVRVSGEKLDALVTAGGELLVARRRTEARAEHLASLLEFAERWQREWRAVRKDVRSTARALPRRSASVLEKSEENVRALRRNLDSLAGGIAADARAIEQAAAPLEESVRRVRMLPFGETCEGLERLVRDLSTSSGKTVEFVIRGADVHLDRSIIEGLKDPLTHLVRNAIDHGIESAAARREGGKFEGGRVTVSAALRGAQVEITVEDDGRGLDVAAIREQARRKTWPLPDEDGEAVKLIFRPGFTTAPIVTELSGRGVGLDVVKTRVESMHGTVDFSFQRGRGTRFVLTLPLTLTTVRALLVASAGHGFAFLGTNVRKLLRVGPGDLRLIEGREMVICGESPVPLSSLAAILGLPGKAARPAGAKVPVVVLMAGDMHAAFAVDELLAEREIVVKSLGARLRRVNFIVGATILPTGRLALILNAAELMRGALHQAPARPLAAAWTAPAAAAKKRLLVVDDSVTTRTLLKSILENSGFDVTAAVDGAEAWSLLQERGADLVVADVEMPRMDGFALTEAIRGSKRFREVPVVLVTALESDRDKARGIDVGADAYLPKSAFDQKNLLQTIAQLL